MELLTVTDLRKMAIHVHCYNLDCAPARVGFIKRLNHAISLAPKIRFWK